MWESAGAGPSQSRPPGRLRWNRGVTAAALTASASTLVAVLVVMLNQPAQIGAERRRAHLDRVRQPVPQPLRTRTPSTKSSSLTSPASAGRGVEDCCRQLASVACEVTGDVGLMHMNLGAQLLGAPNPVNAENVAHRCLYSACQHRKPHGQPAGLMDFAQ